MRLHSEIKIHLGVFADFLGVGIENVVSRLNDMYRDIFTQYFWHLRMIRGVVSI